MKLLHEFEPVLNPTASGADAEFPASNAIETEYDPGVPWIADSYIADAWLMVETTNIIDSVFLNRCNFPQARIQWNATDEWSAPTVDLEVALVRDDAKNRKGWFPITGVTGPGYLKVLIPAGQTLDDSGTAPQIGNLICGQAVTIPIVAEFDPRLVQDINSFKTFYGGYHEEPIGRAQHLISMKIGDDLDPVRNMPKTWALGVLFADLGNVGEAWLVYPARDWSRPIRSLEDAGLSYAFREKP